MTHQMQSVELQGKVTLEWPKGNAFALSYEKITVYDLKLTNGNAKMSLAVEATTLAPGCLLRPRRFLVPGKSQAYLTLVFMPGVLFEEADFNSKDKKAVTLRMALQTSPVDLDRLFDTSPGDDLTKDTLSFFFVPFDPIPPAEEKKTVLERAFQTPGNALYASQMHFHYTSAGYVTAYLFLSSCLPNGKGVQSAADPSTAWYLTPKTPFWYSLANSCEPGQFQVADTPHDQFAFGILTPGGTHLTYLDLKAYGSECFPKGGGFKETDREFILKTFPMENDPKNVRQMSLLCDSVPNRVQQAHTKETRTFVFTGPNHQPQPASITLTNKSRRHSLVYRLQAQEPELFQSKTSLGKLLTIPPNQSATLIVELNPGAKLNPNLISNQLFRLDTFLLDKEAQTEADYWTAMIRSMDARQMKSTFIPCIFKDKPRPSPNWSGGTSDPHAEFTNPPMGQITGLSALGFPIPMLPGPMRDQSPAPNTPDFTDFLAHLGVQNRQQITSPSQPPSSFDLLSGQPFTPHAGLMAPFPGVATPPGGQQGSSSQATPLDAESGLHRWKKKTPESPPNTATPEATSNKPSTGSADKQMATVDNNKSPIGSSTVPQSTRSTVKLPSGAANSPQPSPETPPTKPALISGSSLPTTVPTEAQGKSSAPTPSSSVLRNRHKEKKKTKKRVSPKGPSTHKKTGSPGAAKTRTAQSPPVSPNKSPRHHPSPRRLPCGAPFSPVGHPLPQDMVALFNLVLGMAICLILLNALITNLA